MIKLKYNNQQYGDEILNQSLSEILNNNLLLSMATVTSDNKPWINTVYFSFTNKLEIFFITPKDTVHSQNISNNNGIALSVFDSNQDGSEPKRGLQLFGICKEAKNLDLVIALKSYSQRFPWLKEYILKPSDFLRGVISSRLYKVKINRVKIFDEKLFGEETWIDLIF